MLTAEQSFLKHTTIPIQRMQHRGRAVMSIEGTNLSELSRSLTGAHLAAAIWEQVKSTGLLRSGSEAAQFPITELGREYACAGTRHLIAGRFNIGNVATPISSSAMKNRNVPAVAKSPIVSSGVSSGDVNGLHFRIGKPRVAALAPAPSSVDVKPEGKRVELSQLPFMGLPKVSADLSPAEHVGPRDESGGRYAQVALSGASTVLNAVRTLNTKSATGHGSQESALAPRLGEIAPWTAPTAPRFAPDAARLATRTISPPDSSRHVHAPAGAGLLERTLGASPTSVSRAEPNGLDSQRNAAQIEGDVYLDGALLGKWMTRTLAREAGRASAGGPSFDPRRNALPIGRMIGS
jgi:hypothetical protein